MHTDAHTHLESIEHATVEEVLDRARTAGVTTIVTIADDPASSEAVIATAERHPEVWAVVGVHPNEAQQATPEALTRIGELAGHPRVVGIGETGLDFYRDRCPPARQEEAFRAQIGLAKEHDKALVIHDREAHDDVVRILREEGAPQRTVFHCFSGGSELMRTCADEGWFVSFAGNVTFKSAQPLRDAAALAPLELLLAETDAPFLTPHPFRGEPNEPHRVITTVALLAELHGTPAAEMAAITSRNARRLYHLPA